MNSNKNQNYLMENPDEITRLELKTDPEVIKSEARWCGIKPGLRVLDVGCGSGKTTSILSGLIQPGGAIVGVDYSEDRIQYAKNHYSDSNISFGRHDFRKPITSLGKFDLIWVRFVLEYYLEESRQIISNLTECLKPGGYLCLLDLDHNCLNHYELTKEMEEVLNKFVGFAKERLNFDLYAGRKLYAYLYDEGYESIEVDLKAHHLFYGDLKYSDCFNWLKKIEVASARMKELFSSYPGGYNSFYNDFHSFLNDPRRFTYTPLILSKGRKPL